MSRQLSLLERELGCSLLIRNNCGVELSDAGEVLYTRGKRILKDLDDMALCVREADACACILFHLFQGGPLWKKPLSYILTSIQPGG